MLFNTLARLRFLHWLKPLYITKKKTGIKDTFWRFALRLFLEIWHFFAGWSGSNPQTKQFALGTLGRNAATSPYRQAARREIKGRAEGTCVSVPRCQGWGIFEGDLGSWGLVFCPWNKTDLILGACFWRFTSLQMENYYVLQLTHFPIEADACCVFTPVWGSLQLWSSSIWIISHLFPLHWRNLKPWSHIWIKNELLPQMFGATCGRWCCC